MNAQLQRELEVQVLSELQSIRGLEMEVADTVNERAWFVGTLDAEFLSLRRQISEMSNYELQIRERTIKTIVAEQAKIDCVSQSPHILPLTADCAVYLNTPLITNHGKYERIIINRTNEDPDDDTEIIRCEPPSDGELDPRPATSMRVLKNSASLAAKTADMITQLTTLSSGWLARRQTAQRNAIRNRRQSQQQVIITRATQYDNYIKILAKLKVLVHRWLLMFGQPGCIQEMSRETSRLIRIMNDIEAHDLSNYHDAWINYLKTKALEEKRRKESQAILNEVFKKATKAWIDIDNKNDELINNIWNKIIKDKIKHEHKLREIKAREAKKEKERAAQAAADFMMNERFYRIQRAIEHNKTLKDILPENELINITRDLDYLDEWGEPLDKPKDTEVNDYQENLTIHKHKLSGQVTTDTSPPVSTVDPIARTIVISPVGFKLRQLRAAMGLSTRSVCLEKLLIRNYDNYRNFVKPLKKVEQLRIEEKLEVELRCRLAEYNVNEIVQAMGWMTHSGLQSVRIRNVKRQAVLVTRAPCYRHIPNIVTTPEAISTYLSVYAASERKITHEQAISLIQYLVATGVSDNKALGAVRPTDRTLQLIDVIEEIMSGAKQGSFIMMTIRKIIVDRMQYRVSLRSGVNKEMILSASELRRSQFVGPQTKFCTPMISHKIEYIEVVTHKINKRVKKENIIHSVWSKPFVQLPIDKSGSPYPRGYTTAYSYSEFKRKRQMFHGARESKKHGAVDDFNDYGIADEDGYGGHYEEYDPYLFSDEYIQMQF